MKIALSYEVPGLITPRSAARILQVTTRTIYNYVQDGTIQGTWIKGTLRIYAESVKKAIEKGDTNWVAACQDVPGGSWFIP